MPETASPAVDFSADADLISFLKAIPDGRYRRGVRYPQWYLLLITVLGILSDCRSLRDLEAFAKRHRETLKSLRKNRQIGLGFSLLSADRSPFELVFSDSVGRSTRFQALCPAGTA